MPGIGAFYGGILHPILVLPHLLAVMVFALLVGQRGLRAMQFAYPPYMLALAVGLTLAGFELQPALPTEAILLVFAVACGVLVAAQWPPSAPVCAVVGGLLALLVGLDSGVVDLPRRETFGALLGCWLGAVLLLIVVAGVAEMVRRPWQRVGLRVVGSWITASSVLVLALSFRA